MFMKNSGSSEMDVIFTKLFLKIFNEVQQNYFFRINRKVLLPGIFVAPVENAVDFFANIRLGMRSQRRKKTAA